MVEVLQSGNQNFAKNTTRTKFFPVQTRDGITAQYSPQLPRFVCDLNRLRGAAATPLRAGVAGAVPVLLDLLA